MPVKLLDRLRWSRPVSNETETETGKNVDSDAPPRDAEKDEKEKDVDEGVKPLEDDSDGDTSAAQQGIKDVEAMTHVWTRGHLIAAYVLIWLITFIDAMQQNMSSSLTAYVTSSFSAHSLTSVTGIVANLIGGISKIPLAKILDLWGRPHGFALMVVILTLGLIMMAGCNNVQTYCAAQVFYWVGYNGMAYTIQVFVADTSALRDRGLMFAYLTSPYIGTAWIGGPLATHFYNHYGWRWGYGTFAIVTPVVCAPLLIMFWVDFKRAKDAGLLVKKQDREGAEDGKNVRGQGWLKTFWWYFIELDIIGVLLLCAGLSLFLLSFSIYTYQRNEWRSPLIICFIIFGGLLLFVFAAYERFFAPRCFLPYERLTDRTVLGACVMAGSIQVTFYLWDNYYLSFLQVVMRTSITQASYMGNIYTIGSCVCGLAIGLVIRWSERVKWAPVYFGIPLSALGTGLMIHFRKPGENIGYLAMCQIFIAFGGGACVTAEQVAVMAAVKHQHVAAILAVLGMASSIGASIGSTVAAAIWTSVFPEKLEKYMPKDKLDEVSSIYGSLTVQKSYPVGSAVRTAIDKAYGDAQKLMCVSATCIFLIGWIAAACWRNLKLNGDKRTGLVI